MTPQKSAPDHDAERCICGAYVEPNKQHLIICPLNPANRSAPAGPTEAQGATLQGKDMSKCKHEAWEVLGGGARRCSDCKEVLPAVDSVGQPAATAVEEALTYADSTANPYARTLAAEVKRLRAERGEWLGTLIHPEGEYPLYAPQAAKPEETK